MTRTEQLMAYISANAPVRVCTAADLARAAEMPIGSAHYVLKRLVDEGRVVLEVGDDMVVRLPKRAALEDYDPGNCRCAMCGNPRQPGRGLCARHISENASARPRRYAPDPVTEALGW